MKWIFPLLIALAPMAITASEIDKKGILVNFETIELRELTRFIGVLTKTNFVFKEDVGKYPIHFVCHKRLQQEEILPHFESVLDSHDLTLEKKGSVYQIGKKLTQDEIIRPIPANEIHIIKLQYHTGADVIDAIKQAAIGLSSSQGDLRYAIESTQWVKSTNSIVFSAPYGVDAEVEALIRRIDAPLKQVLVEVLVIDTSVRKGLDFGLDWSLESKSNLNASIGQRLTEKSSFGLNLDIIGDLIRYHGQNYFSLTSLLSALQRESDVRIVLNQKVLAQDNKSSKIFVGVNLPFTGSTIQTTGQAQQTTANIDYKDVGVSLHITPLIGENGMLTLKIDQEISEATNQSIEHNLSGIQTTKTNMSTTAHVPNAHFLVLSGMARDATTHRTSGVPILSSIPLIGGLFTRVEDKEEQRSILIFVRPQLVDTTLYLTTTPT